ncbi:MAG: hypothetical protein ACHP79_09380, partial [Terriglobales bacterium]
ESTHWMVLHRPVELAALTGKVGPSTQATGNPTYKACGIAFELPMSTAAAVPIIILNSQIPA